jgi:hypothetical protein
MKLILYLHFLGVYFGTLRPGSAGCPKSQLRGMPRSCRGRISSATAGHADVKVPITYLLKALTALPQNN